MNFLFLLHTHISTNQSTSLPCWNSDLQGCVLNPNHFFLKFGESDHEWRCRSDLDSQCGSTVLVVSVWCGQPGSVSTILASAMIERDTFNPFW